jgi:hypothetical protein
MITIYTSLIIIICLQLELYLFKLTFIGTLSGARYSARKA